MCVMHQIWLRWQRAVAEFLRVEHRIILQTWETLSFAGNCCNLPIYICSRVRLYSVPNIDFENSPFLTFACSLLKALIRKSSLPIPAALIIGDSPSFPLFSCTKLFIWSFIGIVLEFYHICSRFFHYDCDFTPRQFSHSFSTVDLSLTASYSLLLLPNWSSTSKHLLLISLSNSHFHYIKKISLNSIWKILFFFYRPVVVYYAFLYY